MIARKLEISFKATTNQWERKLETKKAQVMEAFWTLEDIQELMGSSMPMPTS